MKGVIAVLLLVPLVSAGSYVNYSERSMLPHLYPGQSITSTQNVWMFEPLNVGSSTVRWTKNGAYSINLDKIHLEREEYTLIVRSKWGPEIRFVDFETTDFVFGGEKYKANYDEKKFTLWLSRYEDSTSVKTPR